MAHNDNDYDYKPKRCSNHTEKRSHIGRNAIIILLLSLLVMAFALWRLLSLGGYLSVFQSSRSGTSQAESSQTDDAPESGTTSVSDSSSAETPAVSSGAAGEDSTDSSVSTESSGSNEIDLFMLVNSSNPLPDDYKTELTTLSNGQQVATILYPELQEMFDDARAVGVYPIVASGYRTAEKQQSLMDEKIQSFVDQGYSQSDAETEALKWVNAVGCSEHQSGLAVDINADGVHSAGTEVYEWLAENAWQYGFILRYPEGKTDLTGTDYEPWHYRYVGTQAAEEIYQQGVCLEEYLAG